MSNAFELLILYGGTLETGLYFGETWFLYLFVRLIADLYVSIDKERASILKNLGVFLLIIGFGIKSIDFCLFVLQMIFQTGLELATTIKLLSYLPLLLLIVILTHLFFMKKIILNYDKRTLYVINFGVSLTALFLGLLGVLLIPYTQGEIIFLSFILVISLNTIGILSIVTIFMDLILNIELFKLVNPSIYKIGMIIIFLFYESLSIFSLLYATSDVSIRLFFLTLCLISLLGYTTGIVMISVSVSVSYNYLKRGATI